jgi:hypothetical protein
MYLIGRLWMAAHPWRRKVLVVASRIKHFIIRK